MQYPMKNPLNPKSLVIFSRSSNLIRSRVASNQWQHPGQLGYGDRPTTNLLLTIYYTNMPCQCGYPDGMSPRGRMVFPRAEPEGKPSSLGETFHQDTHTGMAYLFYHIEQTQFGKISMKATMIRWCCGKERLLQYQGHRCLVIHTFPARRH